MSFFVMQYRVLFHDTMAYGSHHFLTNFKFQCVAREHMFFAHVAEASEEGRRDHDRHVLLTQQAYMRSLAPVLVGQRVAVLVSAEEQTPSSVRLCFRIVRDDGVPVSCGFQTLVCVSRATGEVSVAPASIRRGEDLMREQLADPPFAERVLSGRLRGVFDDQVLTVATAVAQAPPERSYPRFLDQDAARAIVGPTAPPDLGRGVVFVCAGQGSYSLPILAGLLLEVEEGRDLLAMGERLCRERLGASLVGLVEAASDEEHAARLGRSPELAQVAVYLSSVLAARSLVAHGLKPDAVMGHSAGEIAALAVAGACSLQDGLAVMVERARALRAAVGAGGGMLAVFVTPERVSALLKVLALPSLDLAVINHDEQAVVSGLDTDLSRLAEAARALGITTSRVPSPFAFHSRELAPAVAPFREALRKVRLGPAKVPVYSAMEGGFCPPDRIDLPSHFVRSLDFAEALRRVHAAGARSFVECGARVLGSFVRRVLVGRSEVEVFSPFDPDRDGRTRLVEALEKLAERGLRPRPSPAPPAAASARTAPARKSPPIAVVALGSVLPGSSGPDDFWRQILAGTSGLSDAAERQPELAEYFMHAGGVVPDKTYTFLGGFVQDPAAPDKLPYSAEEFGRLTLAQRLLATALGQCLDALPGGRPDPARTLVLIGATADGIREYDEALLAASLARAAEGLAAPPEERRAFTRTLEEILGRNREDLPRVSPLTSYTEVVHRLLGGAARLVTVDAACASSLYSVVLGVEALHARECDLVLAGGVFAPGPASSCLFSQFQGLSARASRPFDASADGVVFGEGSAFLALKRLSDCLEAKDEVLAVVRGFGLSSDGKSPSVAVPKKQGQTLAMRRAYAATGIDPGTVQYVEAHATSTPVGDAVEFSALSEVFQSSAGETPVELGSVKALIGHTGWTAGSASLVKMAMALRERVLPPQAGYESSLQTIDLKRSPFAISPAAKPWPPNRDGEPRRATVSGFGFGGTNAHVILEEFDREYHTKHLTPGGPAEVPAAVVAVGFQALFPFERGDLRFAPQDAALPEGLRILPDVAEDMDPSQRTAVRMASLVLQGVGTWWKGARDAIGLVLGLDGKTERSIQANQRIYLDLVRGRLRDRPRDEALTDEARAALGEGLVAALRTIRPSGPYTLPGLMPNVVAGRAANMLNLHGPNLVVGRGEMSLLEALRAGRQLLLGGGCDLVLAGAMSGYAGAEGEAEVQHRPARGGRAFGEGVLMVALMRSDTAREHRLETLAEIHFGGEADESCRRVEVGKNGWPYLRSAEGSLELRAALEQARAGVTTVLSWPGDAGATLRLGPVAERASVEERAPVHEAHLRSAEPPGKVPGPATRPVIPGIRGPETPIVTSTPVLVPVPLPTPGTHAPPASRLLLLVDQQAALASLGPWRGRVRAVACPASRPVAGALPIDLGSEAALSATLDALHLEGCDSIVAVKDAGDLAPVDALGGEFEGGDGGGLLHLLFVVARRAYERLAAGQASLGSLVLRGLQGDHPHAYSGLLGGFTKSIARELPGAFVKSVITDTAELESGLRALEAEWGLGSRPGAVEVVVRNGVREEFRLCRTQGLSTPGEAWLRPDSVVVATGGGRGVTAVLLEEVLRRFGPTLVVVGRSDPRQHPAELVGLSEEEFRLREPEFYRAELLRDSGQRMADLKRRLEACRGARELREGLDRLRSLSPRVEYRTLDVSDPAAVDALVAEVVSRHGRLDLVIHGAALQSSRGVARKPLQEFTRVAAAKVMGAVNFARSCERHRPGQVRHHVLTSAFSFFGNDGQCDYGAANEALGRLATRMGSGRWTSLAWLGWAGIGMTRGSEYAELARSRGVKAVTAGEGQALFASLLQGEPRAAEHVLVTEGEVAYYGVPPELLGLDSDEGVGHAAPLRFASGSAAAPSRAEQTFRLDLVSWPYLRHHVVRDRPTVPGTFESELAARAAKQLRPACHVVEMQGSRLPRFARLDHQDTVELRGVAEVVEERGTDTLARVRLLSDFVHKGGRVLQKDVLHFETLVRLAPGLEISPVPDGGPWQGGLRVLDPYLSPLAPVRLDGFFRCLRDIEIGGAGRRARVDFGGDPDLALLADFLTPAVLLDALFRFSMIHVEPTGMMPVYVPVRCGRTLLVPGLNDASLHAAGERMTLAAGGPRVDGERGFSPWARVEDSRGRTVLYVEDLEAVRVGEVPGGG